MKRPRAARRPVYLVLAAAAAVILSIFPTALPTSQNVHVAQAATTNTNSSNSVYYRQTGHYIKDAFLNYWLMNGSVTLYGYPVSEETTIDGVAVQYFQRARFEYRANSTRPWKVELTHSGAIVTAGRSFEQVSAAAATGDRTFYPETGHTVGGTFSQFWANNGGLAIFGYPISEEIRENGLTVQYFERARFELAGQGRVQLGHVGTELMNKQIAEGTIDAAIAAPRTRPGYNMSFKGNATVFNADWERVISLNKGWGNLPQDYVGRGLYAAAPADLHLYGRTARVTRGNRSVFVQFIDVINWPDIPYVRSKGIVIDLGQEAFEALGQYNGGRYEVSFDVFWPGEEP
ncbi:MAG: hypothetical protein ABI670_23080 [Chloroflexota bacterium]